MARYDYDLFTLGAGSGGVRASRISAGYGARVAVAEERDLGGTCVNVGCIPKKLLVYAAHYRDDFEDARGFGWTVGPQSHSWQTLIENKNAEISRLNGVYARILNDAGVERIEGHAVLEDAHTVSVDGRRFTAENVLVATGSWPSLPDVPGSELVFTSNEAFHLKTLPRRVLIVGGGYIAVEFAGIFHGLGAEVVQLYRGPLFLRGFDDDVRAALAVEMRKKGIDLRFDANVARIEKSDDGLRATLEDGSVEEADGILYATGRKPLTASLGLEEAGVELAPNGAVVVDAFSRSSVPSIWAIGDATDRINLTPVALHEGMALAATLFDGRPTQPDHETVPSAVFSNPPIGTVGLTEARAREVYGAVDVYRSRFRPLRHTLTGVDEETLMKLVVDPASDRVVGLHMLGPDAGEIVQGFAVALKAGATKAQFDATIGIHPTAAEEFVTLREKSN
jgi:glutathione reductase (NADPH)